MVQNTNSVENYYIILDELPNFSEPWFLRLYDTDGLHPRAGLTRSELAQLQDRRKSLELATETSVV